jgi:Na+/phosphate symporter
MLIYLPFLGWFSRAVVEFAGDVGLAVVLAHSIFNLTIAIAFLLSLDWVAPLLSGLSDLPNEPGRLGAPRTPPSGAHA